LHKTSKYFFDRGRHCPGEAIISFHLMGGIGADQAKKQPLHGLNRPGQPLGLLPDAVHGEAQGRRQDEQRQQGCSDLQPVTGMHDTPLLQKTLRDMRERREQADKLNNAWPMQAKTCPGGAEHRQDKPLYPQPQDQPP